MSDVTPGQWRIPAANIFRIIAVDEHGNATRLIHDQPDMVSYFGNKKLEWKEDDGLEVVANTRLMSAAKEMLAVCKAIVACDGFVDEQTGAIIRQARLAIAKAEKP